MPKFFVKTNQIYNNEYIILENEDTRHIKNVLRMKENEEINIANKDTSENYLCIIDSFQSDTVKCKILKQYQSVSELKVQMSIFQALPKAEKMELIIQKCTEIGVHNFIPVVMERCIVKIDKKSEVKKIERWQKIAESAAKQSGRDIIPEVKNIINLKKLCQLVEKYDIVLVAYEREKINTLKSELMNIKNKISSIGIIIGPEGGFEEDEIKLLKQNGVKAITLGNRILRTETASIYLSSILTYELE